MMTGCPHDDVDVQLVGKRSGFAPRRRIDEPPVEVFPLCESTTRIAQTRLELFNLTQVDIVSPVFHCV